MSRNQRGFTLVELMIATTIFSVMMLLATAGILAIGRIYYKGIIITKTQELARVTIEDISHNIQTSINVGGNEDHGVTVTPPNFAGRGAYCIGTARYSYSLDKKMGAGAGDVKYPLWADYIKAGTKVCPPLDDNGNPDTNSAPTSGRSLLAENTRITKFSITPGTVDRPASVTVMVVYGELDLSPPPNYTCEAIDRGGQYCAFSELSTSVKSRLY